MNKKLTHSFSGMVIKKTSHFSGNYLLDETGLVGRIDKSNENRQNTPQIVFENDWKLMKVLQCLHL